MAGGSSFVSIIGGHIRDCLGGIVQHRATRGNGIPEMDRPDVHHRANPTVLRRDNQLTSLD